MLKKSCKDKTQRKKAQEFQAKCHSFSRNNRQEEEKQSESSLIIRSQQRANEDEMNVDRDFHQTDRMSHIQLDKPPTAFSHKGQPRDLF